VIAISAYLKKLAVTSSDLSFWSDKLQEDFGLRLILDKGVYDASSIARQIYAILRPVPAPLIKDCGVNTLFLRFLGENKPYYPNHGYYRAADQSITLNTDIFYHPDQPDDFFDSRGYFISRAAQTLLHELSHGYDANHGELSLQPAWMSLSGWSQTYKPGLKRLLIKDPGAPEVLGEMFYDPHVGAFTRFYAKRNSWDDFADSFSMFVGGLKDKVPANKRAYFDKLLAKYK